ncbi:PorP/SprF family type IX secretion system membrane protein, partial [Aquirufa sp. ROCK2-A2]
MNFTLCFIKSCSVNLNILKNGKRYFSITFLIAFIFLSHASYSQIEAMYSLYKLNPQYISPVQSGSTENSEIIVSNRQQWIGLDGAPKTLGVTANVKWKYNKGVGMIAYQDQAGPMTVTNIATDFAYHIRLDQKWTMSGGIRAGLLNL